MSMLNKLKKIFYKKNRFDCPVCNSKNVALNPLSMHYFSELQKHQTIHNIFLFETLNIQFFSCNKCGASDRDRLYALYFNDYLKSQNAPINLLDIAPADQLRTFLKKQRQINYRSMDLYMENVDDRADIIDMNIYKEGQFDFFICSHVLEHIPDDLKAMKELYRVLKKGGKGIVMVPMNLGVEKTLEDANCVDVATRWKYYFQDDHVRMYSKKDFIQRLETTGFTVEQLGIDTFGEKKFNQNGIYPTSVLYIVSK